MGDSISNLLGEIDPVEQALESLRDLSVAPLTREEVYPITEQQAPEPLPVPAAAENAVSEAERPTATTPDIFAAPSNALGSFDITPQLPEPIFGYQPPRLPDLQTEQRMRELREFEELRRLLEQNTLGLNRPTDRGVERLSNSVAAEFGFSDDIKILGLPVADRGFLGNMMYYLGTPFRGVNALVMDAQLGLIRGRAALEEAVMGGMSVGTREALRRFSQPNLSANPDFNGTNYAQEDTWLYRRLPNFMAASSGAFLSPLEGPTVSSVTGTNLRNLRKETFINPWSNNFYGINPLVLPLAPAVVLDEALGTNLTGSTIQSLGGTDVLPGASLEELIDRGDTGYGLATNAPRFLGGGGGQRFDERGNRPVLESVLGFADSVKAMTLNVGLEVLTPGDLSVDALFTPLAQAGGNMLARAVGRAQQAGATSREARRVRVPASTGVGKPSTIVVYDPAVLDAIDVPYTTTKFLTGSEAEEFRMPFNLPPGPEPTPIPIVPAPRMLGPGGARAVASFDEFSPVEVYERLPLDMLRRRDFDAPLVQAAPEPTMLDIALRDMPPQTPSTTLIPNVDFTNDVFADMTNQYTQAIDSFIVEQGLDRPASLIPGDFTVVDEFTAGVSRSDLDITDLVPAEARQAQLVRDFYANKPYKPPTIRIVAPVTRTQASMQAQVIQDVRRVDFSGVTVDVDAVTMQDFVRSANQGTTSSIDAFIADELAKNINYNVVDDLIDGTRIPAPASILPNGQVRVSRLALPAAPELNPLAGVPPTQTLPSSGRVIITPVGAARKAPTTIDVVARTIVDTEETLESALKLRQQLDSGDWVAPAEKSMRELASRIGITVGDKPTGVELFTQIGDYARRELENVSNNTVKALTQKIKALGLRGYSGKKKAELIVMYGDGLRALGDFNPDRVPTELWTADGVTLREAKENAILDAQAAGLERVRQVQVNLANPRQRLVGIGSWSADGLTLTDIAEEAVAKLENPTAIKAAKAKVSTKTAQTDAVQATQKLNDQIIHENTQELTQSLTSFTRTIQAREAKAKQRALDNARASSKPKPRKEISFAQAKEIAENLYEDVATKLSEPGLRPAAILAEFNSYADALREMLRSLPKGTSKEDLQELIADLAEARAYAVEALLDGAFNMPAINYLTKADDLTVAVSELRNYIITVVPDTTPANAGIQQAALERIKELADFASQVRPKTTKSVSVVDPDAPSDITKLEGPDLPTKSATRATISTASAVEAGASARIAELTEKLDDAIAEGNMRKADAIQRQLDKLAEQAANTVDSASAYAEDALAAINKASENEPKISDDVQYSISTDPDDLERSRSNARTREEINELVERIDNLGILKPIYSGPMPLSKVQKAVQEYYAGKYVYTTKPEHLNLDVVNTLVAYIDPKGVRSGGKVFKYNNFVRTITLDGVEVERTLDNVIAAYKEEGVDAIAEVGGVDRLYALVAAKIYSDGPYVVINGLSKYGLEFIRALLTGTPKLPGTSMSNNELIGRMTQIAKVMPAIDVGMSLLPEVSGKKLYRGVFRSELPEDWVEGAVIASGGYTSTSTSLGAVREYRGSRGWIIEYDESTSGRNLSSLSAFSTEQEVLIPKGASFEIVEIDKASRYIRMRQVDAVGKQPTMPVQNVSQSPASVVPTTTTDSAVQGIKYPANVGTLLSNVLNVPKDTVFNTLGKPYAKLRPDELAKYPVRKLSTPEIKQLIPLIQASPEGKLQQLAQLQHLPSESIQTIVEKQLKIVPHVGVVDEAVPGTIYTGESVEAIQRQLDKLEQGDVDSIISNTSTGAASTETTAQVVVYGDKVISLLSSALRVTPEEVRSVLGKPYAKLRPDELAKYPIRKLSISEMKELIPLIKASPERIIEQLGQLQHVSPEIVLSLYNGGVRIVPLAEAVDKAAPYYLPRMASGQSAGLYIPKLNILYAGESVEVFQHEAIHAYIYNYHEAVKHKDYSKDSDLVSMFANTIGILIPELRKLEGYSELLELTAETAARAKEQAASGTLQPNYSLEVFHMRHVEGNESMAASFRYGRPVLVLAYVDNMSMQVLGRPLNTASLLEDLYAIKTAYRASNTTDFFVAPAFEEEVFNYLTDPLPGVKEAFMYDEAISQDTLDNLQLNVLIGDMYVRRTNATTTTGATGSLRELPTAGDVSIRRGDNGTGGAGTVSADDARSAVNTVDSMESLVEKAVKEDLAGAEFSNKYEYSIGTPPERRSFAEVEEIMSQVDLAATAHYLTARPMQPSDVKKVITEYYASTVEKPDRTLGQTLITVLMRVVDPREKLKTYAGRNENLEDVIQFYNDKGVDALALIGGEDNIYLRAAVRMYTDGPFSIINGISKYGDGFMRQYAREQVYRTPERILDHFKVIPKFIPALDAGVISLPRVENTTLYRGVKQPTLKSGWVEGGYVTDFGYLSTSTSKRTAELYKREEGWLLEYNKTYGHSLDSVSGWRGELEVLIPRFSGFQITKIDEASRVISLEQVTLEKALQDNNLFYYYSDMLYNEYGTAYDYDPRVLFARLSEQLERVHGYGLPKPIMKTAFEYTPGTVLSASDAFPLSNTIVDTYEKLQSPSLLDPGYVEAYEKAMEICGL